MVTALYIYIYIYIHAYICNVCDFKDSLKQDLALEFCKNHNKDFSVFTEIQINHHQVHHINNNWLGPILFCLDYSHTKGLLIQIYPVLKVSLWLTQIQSGELCP